MWKLFGKKTKGNDAPQGEKKPRETSNHGPPVPGNHHAAASSRHNTEHQPRTHETDVERHPEIEECLNRAPGLSQASNGYAMVNVEDLEVDDIVIAVLGPTGTGKSTFIRRASGHDDDRGVGHGLKSFTSDVIAFKFLDKESGRNFVLVDTPSFDDTFKSDLEILNMIADWLGSSYRKEKLLSGILYFHRITDNRMAGTPLKSLRLFRRLCGNDALDKVYLTTTMWDEVDPGFGERRLAELTQEYWRAMVNQGARIARCRNDDDSSKKLIQTILEQESVRKAGLLQEEMIKLKELKETGAGQELYSQLEKLFEKQLVLLRRIDEERKKASDSLSMMEELQTEYKELWEQIDERLCQVQSPPLKNHRLFSQKRD